jgi:hypothetical protein
MNEGNGGQAVNAVVSRHRGGYLQEALATHEVGLKTRAERIAPPGHAGCVKARTAQQRVIQDSAKRRAWGPLIGHAAAYDGKDLKQGQSILREEPIGGAPILKLRAGSGEQTRHGMASEAEQRTQRERLRAVGDAALVEGGDAFVPEPLELGKDTGRVFFKVGGGASSRRSASSALSSTIHSTVSPRENSMA